MEPINGFCNQKSQLLRRVYENRNCYWCSCPSLTHTMAEAKDNSFLTDVQFIIGKESSKKTFNAHKLILACRSPVFEKMFFGDTAEKRNPIVIEEDEPEMFEMLLHYIYGLQEKLNLDSLFNAWKFYSIGNKYLVKGIAEDVERFIQLTCMKEEDFWNLIESNLHTRPILISKIGSYLHSNAVEILRSENFTNMPESLVADILLMEKLNVPEIELLQCVAKWGTFNFDGRQLSKNMLQLLQHIRFSVLEIDEFCYFTDRFPDAIDTQSCVKIMKFLQNKSVYKLPDWCSTNSNSRNPNNESNSQNSTTRSHNSEKALETGYTESEKKIGTSQKLLLACLISSKGDLVNHFYILTLCLKILIFHILPYYYHIITIIIFYHITVVVFPILHCKA